MANTAGASRHRGQTGANRSANGVDGGDRANERDAVTDADCSTTSRPGAWSTTTPTATPCRPAWPRADHRLLRVRPDRRQPPHRQPGRPAACCAASRTPATGPIALAGGATGMIGDPSGRSDERNLLDDATLDANLAAHHGASSRGSSTSTGPTQARWSTTATWTEALSAARLPPRRGQARHRQPRCWPRSRCEPASRASTGISFTEFSYMLLQANDYLHLHEHHGCELQVGGSDQWGNITAGIDLIRRRAGAARPRPDRARCITAVRRHEVRQDRRGRASGSPPTGRSPYQLLPVLDATSTTPTSSGSCCSSPCCRSTRSRAIVADHAEAARAPAGPAAPGPRDHRPGARRRGARPRPRRRPACCSAAIPSERRRRGRSPSLGRRDPHRRRRPRRLVDGGDRASTSLRRDRPGDVEGRGPPRRSTRAAST